MSDLKSLYRQEAVDASRRRLGAPVKSVGLTTWALTIFMVALVGAVVSFVSFARFARVESVPGTLEPLAGAARVVAPRAAVITEVHVTDGQIVDAGDPLFTLGSDVVIDGGAALGAVLKEASHSQTEALEAQYQAARSSQLQESRELHARRDGLTQRARRLQGEVELARQRLKLNEATLASYDGLRAKGYVSEIRYRTQQATLLDDQRAISSILGELETTLAAIEESEAALRRVEAQSAQALAGIESTKATLRERSATASAQSSVTVVSPRNGRVSLQSRAGASVTIGGALAVVLPPGAALKAQLWAPSRAAGFVQVGDKVRLLYDAFPYERFGAGQGRVTAIASAPTAPADVPFATETTEALYRIDVELSRQTVHAYGRDWPLAVGSRLTGDVVLESRTLLSSVLDPIRAIEERRLQ